MLIRCMIYSWLLSPLKLVWMNSSSNDKFCLFWTNFTTRNLATLLKLRLTESFCVSLPLQLRSRHSLKITTKIWHQKVPTIIIIYHFQQIDDKFWIFSKTVRYENIKNISCSVSVIRLRILSPKITMRFDWAATKKCVKSCISCLRI